MENMLITQRNIGKILRTNPFSKDSTPIDHSMFFDGCSKGNPGPGGAGAVIYNNNDELTHVSVNVGDIVTNNHAEYIGLIQGLNLAIKCEIKRLRIYGDSQLVIKQMRGEYKVNHPNLIVDYKTAKELEKKFIAIEYHSIPRKENSRADELANLGLLESKIVDKTQPIMLC
jgi:ribonuclease HI